MTPDEKGEQEGKWKTLHLTLTLVQYIPEGLFEEDGKEDDADAGSHLDDDLDEIPPAFKVLADHQGRRLPHQGHCDAH